MGFFIGVLRTGTVDAVREALRGIDATIYEEGDLPHSVDTPPPPPPTPPAMPVGPSVGFTGWNTLGIVSTYFEDGVPIKCQTNAGAYREATVKTAFWDALRISWPAELWAEAIAVAFLESDFIPTAKNPSPLEDSWGYFQINRNAWPMWSPEFLIDPLNNCIAAYEVYRQQGWPAWFHSATAAGLI